jgi:hypothetical protein
VTYVPAELRRRIIELSGDCCEYCRTPHDIGTAQQNYHVEHIIAESHGGVTIEANLAFSCPKCNLYKGTNIATADPETGEPTFLFHPRRHQWGDHFRLDGALIEPLTPEGRATVFVLQLNAPERVEKRLALILLGRYPC